MKKVEAYYQNLYECPVPPVCTVYWGFESWIAWIDMKGTWTVAVE